VRVSRRFVQHLAHSVAIRGLLGNNSGSDSSLDGVTA